MNVTAKLLLFFLLVASVTAVMIFMAIRTSDAFMVTLYALFACGGIVSMGLFASAVWDARKKK
ncbi:hypothetical protein GTW74_28675 [Streptomyces sp. SID8370]|uniref:hypothetical protein n=1 Tax=Streptomyces sp. SID8370 TaxID=2690351 RepID=UPI0011C46482|nr:hypothetical protein [Streptomyces sp. SID8370]